MESDFDRNSSRMTDEVTEDTCVEEEKPNTVIKLDSETCDIDILSFNDIQDRSESSCEKNGSLHYVKEEEIEIEENHLVKDDPESKW